MARLTDHEKDIRAGARKVKKLEAELKQAGAKLDDLRVTEALIERVVIAPLTAGLEAAKTKLAETQAIEATFKAESADRMAKLKARLAASKAKGF